MFHASEELAPTQSKKYLRSTESSNNLIPEAAFPVFSLVISFYYYEN